MPVSVRPATTVPAGVAAAAAFRHSGCRTGYRTVTLGSRLSTPCFNRADFDSECSRAAMSSSPVSDVVPVARWTCYQKQAGLCYTAPSFHQCLRRLWTGALFGYVNYYEQVLATQTPRVTGIYGRCGPGGRRVADVLQCAGRSFGYFPGRRPVDDT